MKYLEQVTAKIPTMDLDSKITLAQKLLESIAADSIGWECNRHLCQWLYDTARELEDRCA